MKELNLLLQLPQDVSTRYRSVDMTVLAAFAISFCQRHCVSLCKGTKAPEFGLRRIPGIICRFSLWNSAGCVRIWLEGLGKAGLFRCQSIPGPPYAVPSLFEIGILITEFSVSWIRWLWLEGLGKAGLFRCQSAFAISFCQRHCVSLCKGTKLQKAVLFAIVRRSFMEGSCQGFFASNWLCSKPGKSLCDGI